MFEKLNKPFGTSKIKYLRKFIIFGILNLTPDSFSDGGDFVDNKKSIEKAKSMFENGADFIDIGGESTRPERARYQNTMKFLGFANYPGFKTSQYPYLS